MGATPYDQRVTTNSRILAGAAVGIALLGALLYTVARTEREPDGARGPSSDVASAGAAGAHARPATDGAASDEAGAREAVAPAGVIDLNGFGTSPAEFAASRGGIDGVVVDPSGRPVPGATVWLATTDLRSTGEERATTGALGGFSIDGVQPGTVHLAPFFADFASSWSGSIPVFAGERTTGVVLELERGEALRGRVYERGTGQGLVATLTFASANGARSVSATSGPDGSYVAAGLRHGDSVIFSVECPGYGYAVADDAFGGPNAFALTAPRLAEAFDVPMRVLPPRPETLIVLDELTGEPVAGAVVKRAPGGAPLLPPSQPLEAKLGTTDRNGRIVLEGGWPSAFRVSADGYVPKDWDGVSASSEAGVFDVSISPACTITVDVAAVGAVVRVTEWARRTPLLAHGKTNERGIVELDGLPIGRVRVSAYDAEGRRGAERIVILPTRDPVVLELEAYARVTGRVAPATAGQRVLALVHDRPPFIADIDARGAYALDLPAGEYAIGVEDAPHATYGFFASTWSARPEVVLTLAPGEERTLDLVGFDGPGSLRGVLVAAGRDVAFQTIAITWTDDAEHRLPPEPMRAGTDATGAFRVPSLAPGRCSVRWLAPDGDAIVSREVDVVAGETATVELSPTTGTIRVLGAPLTEVVVNGPDGGVDTTALIPASGILFVERSPGTYWVGRLGARENERVELAQGALVEVILPE